MRTELEYAQEDERVCDRLYEDGISRRWTVVSAFYAALHYVNHYIFPLVLEDDEGDTIEVLSVDAYLNTTFESGKPHAVRVKLLRHKLREEGHTGRIARQYKKLMDRSEKARYTTGEITEHDVEKARERLSIIKQFCVSELTEDQDEAVPVEVKKR